MKIMKHYLAHLSLIATANTERRHDAMTQSKIPHLPVTDQHTNFHCWSQPITKDSCYYIHDPGWHSGPDHITIEQYATCWRLRQRFIADQRSVLQLPNWCSEKCHRSTPYLMNLSLRWASASRKSLQFVMSEEIQILFAQRKSCVVVFQYWWWWRWGDQMWQRRMQGNLAETKSRPEIHNASAAIRIRPADESDDISCDGKFLIPQGLFIS